MTIFTTPKLNLKDFLEILENALAYIVVFAMFAYGIGKIIQFEYAVDINKRVSELTGMQLMWAFYGYSKAFVITIGFLEIFGGFLLFYKKTRVLGCLFVSTLLINIIIQDFFYEVNLGALKAALIYQSFLLVILWFHRSKLLQSLSILTTFPVLKRSRKEYFFVIALSIIFFIFLRILEYFITTKF